MKIFFYAWTNVVLLNAVNTKINYYQNTSADLLIRCSATLFQPLIQQIEALGIFENVYYIDMPRIRKTGKGIKKIPKFRFIGVRKDIRSFYSRYVRENFTDEIYSTFLTAGLWNDTLHLFRELHKKNKEIRMEFIEEGERSYEGIKSLLEPILGGTWKNKLVEKYNIGFYKHKYKNNITNKIYLYRPDRYGEKENESMFRLPIIDRTENSICFRLFENISEALDYSILLRYEKRTAFFLANYLVPKYEANYDIAKKTIDTMIKIFCANNIMIKTHSSSTEHRLNFAKEYEKRVFVDRGAYLFEGIYTKIDVGNKVLIAKNSTALLYPKQLFDQEPYLVFTYRLYDYYHENGDEITDNYIASLKSLYKNKDKIIVPNTFYELENKLKRVYEHILDQRYKER